MERIKKRKEGDCKNVENLLDGTDLKLRAMSESTIALTAYQKQSFQNSAPSLSSPRPRWVPLLHSLNPVHPVNPVKKICPRMKKP